MPMCWPAPIWRSSGRSAERGACPGGAGPARAAVGRALRRRGLEGAWPRSSRAVFNAGELPMDLQAWRAEDIEGERSQYARPYWQRVYFWDQEGLNATLAGRWAPPDPAWNWSPSLGAPGVEARLIHFTGNLKPWRYRGRSRLAPVVLCGTGSNRLGWLAAGSSAGGQDGRLCTRQVRCAAVLRPVERWHMAFTRRRTLRTAGISDRLHLPGLGDLSRLSEG